LAASLVVEKTSVLIVADGALHSRGRVERVPPVQSRPASGSAARDHFCICSRPTRTPSGWTNPWDSDFAAPRPLCSPGRRRNTDRPDGGLPISRMREGRRCLLIGLNASAGHLVRLQSGALPRLRA
jgi:hypothetical protein